MCLVEIKSQRPMALPILAWDEKKKDYVESTKNKLQPACQIEVRDGMEVVSKGAAVEQAQASVQEFLLLNHPVDCPICDQAGECKLQDYWLAHQKKLKRKTTEPVHKPKAVTFGPTIVYDAERCIMCTRCVRFCDEVVGDHVLDMRERGNKNEICLSPGRTLDHDYTLMTEHVCPVGALTSKDFRFKARVWFLRSAPSVCNGCATGCNTWVDYDPRTQQVYRLRPRDNEAVNKFWMCDSGMMSYKQFHGDRVLTGRVRQDGRTVEIPRDASLDAAARVLDSKRRFLEAALRYADLARLPAELVDDDSLTASLEKAVNCILLAPLGASRQRVMGALMREERVARISVSGARARGARGRGAGARPPNPPPHAPESAARFVLDAAAHVDGAADICGRRGGLWRGAARAYARD
jgi:NADH dehydrogenase/NADH:ubiquinone oxidoreductase subunit G